MRSFWIGLLLAGISLAEVRAQRNVNAEAPLQRGFSFAYGLTHRGAGLSAQYYLGAGDAQWLVALDAFHVKDLRETIIDPSPIFGQQGRRYIFGKLNNLYVISPGIGWEKRLFPKGSGNTVEVSWGAKAGPALGLLIPYLLEVYVPVGPGGSATTLVEPFDPGIHTFNRIVGKGNIFANGFSASMQLGLSLKSYLRLEMSHTPKFINGLLLTLNADLFPNEVPLLARADGAIENRRLYIAGGFGIAFGNRW
ncbi:MAG: hypothetical protein AAFR61_06975 [Bacteroidota bacterium]